MATFYEQFDEAAKKSPLNRAKRQNAIEMIILIEHKQHGRMHVYSLNELNKHKELGWYEVVNDPATDNKVNKRPYNRRK